MKSKDRYKDPDYQKKWREAHPGYATEYMKGYRKGEKWQRYRRNRHLKRNYNLTVVEWTLLFEKQGKCCAVCKAMEPGWYRGWQTDHCHITGKVRGILCGRCNRMLPDGMTAELLIEMIKYLKTNE